MATKMQVGGWYNGQQFNGTSLGPKGVITVGNKGGGGSSGGGGGGGSTASGGQGKAYTPPPPPPDRNKKGINQGSIPTFQNAIPGLTGNLPSGMQFGTSAQVPGTTGSLPSSMNFGTASQLPSMSTSAPAPSKLPTMSTTASPTSMNAPKQTTPTTSFVKGTPDQYKTPIAQASQKYGVPTSILSALLKQESGFNPHAVSPVGASGIAQFMPGTAKTYKIDPFDPLQSIDAAGQYLKNSLNQFGGNMAHALASYNAGAGAVKQFGGIPPYKETQDYVKNITSMANSAIPENVDIGNNLAMADTQGQSTDLTPGSPDFYTNAMAKLNQLQGRLNDTPQAEDSNLLTRYSQAQQDPRFQNYLSNTGGSGGGAQLASGQSGSTPGAYDQHNEALTHIRELSKTLAQLQDQKNSANPQSGQPQQIDQNPMSGTINVMDLSGQDERKKRRDMGIV